MVCVFKTYLFFFESVWIQSLLFLPLQCPRGQDVYDLSGISHQYSSLRPRCIDYGAGVAPTAPAGDDAAREAFTGGTLNFLATGSCSEDFNVIYFVFHRCRYLHFRLDHSTSYCCCRSCEQYEEKYYIYCFRQFWYKQLVRVSNFQRPGYFPLWTNTYKYRRKKFLLYRFDL